MEISGPVRKNACDRANWRGLVTSMPLRNLANPLDGEETGSKLT